MLADLRMRGHRSAVGIGQRDLALAGSLQFPKHRRVASTLVAKPLDLFREVFRPRAARSGLRDIAVIEPIHVFIQALVRRANERLQRMAREVAILVVDRLDPRAVHGEQFAPEKIKPPAQQHELTKHRFEGVAIVAPEIRDGLEVGLQRPQ